MNRRLPVEIITDWLEWLRESSYSSHDMAIGIIEALEAEGWVLDCVSVPGDNYYTVNQDGTCSIEALEAEGWVLDCVSVPGDNYNTVNQDGTCSNCHKVREHVRRQK